MPAVHAMEAELVPGRQLLGPGADVGDALRVLVGQLVRLGEALAAGHLHVLVAHDLVGAAVELDRRRVAPISAHRSPKTSSSAGTSSGKTLRLSSSQ